MYFINDDGEEIILKSVVSISAVTGNAGREYYQVNFSGGYHMTVKEAFKTRAAFVIEWKSANA